MPTDSGALNSGELILGEETRSLDERRRLALPSEMVEILGAAGEDCILAKERPGCLSLWNAAVWKQKLDSGLSLIQAKVAAGRLNDRLEELQMLGRLASTRHTK